MEDVEAEGEREEKQEVIKVLELLKEACQELQRQPSRREWLRALQDLESIVSHESEFESESRVCLFDHLSSLHSLVHTLHSTPHHSFLRRRLTSLHISRVASSIESELQAWIDRQLVYSLLHAFHSDSDSDSLIPLLREFQQRLSRGLNLHLQELILKSALFSHLETLLAHPSHGHPISLREEAAFSIQALISFNKNVFVGQVLMGPTTKALVSMASPSSFKVLCSLITSIKSPLVDEIHSNGLIPSIIGFLSSSSEMQLIALECVMEIGYYGRKEAVEAMMNAGVVEVLLHLQTSMCNDEDEDDEDDSHPFAACVATFAVQLEVGQGLRQREKRAFKHHILTRLRDASLSQAQAATIEAQVLWGSFS